MLGKAYTSVISGISAFRVKVEADISAGIPSFDMTGNLGVSAREARGRVRMAIKNSGIRLAPSKTTVNIAPADLRKEGTHYDLAIAMALLEANGKVNLEKFENTIFIGELGLDGEIRPVSGVLPMVINGYKDGVSHFILPLGNVAEASYVKNVEITGVKTLAETIEYIAGRKTIASAICVEKSREVINKKDFTDIRGQTAVKRAVMIAAASMHNILLIGPPGSGKTMAAERISSILPPLTYEQQLELSQIYSVAGLLKGDVYFMDKRTFRSPHHSITPQAMAGGGSNPMPGEMSLACHGVLFLDEFNLFNPNTVEMLRQPMESGKISINRIHGSIEYPADFMLVAAMNPCRCGYYPDRSRCHCTPADIRTHFGKISRPIIDRIDICVQAPKPIYSDIEKDVPDIYTGSYMKNKVLKAFNVQKMRFAGCDFSLNSKIPSRYIQKYCQVDKDGSELLKIVFDKYNLSARGYHKLLRVARTIADLEESDLIGVEHISEAVGYRLIGGAYE